jgi:hypothetical protein
MKNTFKLLGIIVMVAIIGFSMAACGGDDDNGGGGITVSITGEAKVGAKITAKVEGSTRYDFGWLIVDKADDEDGTYAGGVTETSGYTVDEDDVGKYIRAEVMDLENGKYAYSNAIGPIVAK